MSNFSRRCKAKISVNRFADTYPLAEASSDKFKKLKQTIGEVGQVKPCEFYKGELVDGRNRWLACESIGVTPVRKNLTKKDLQGCKSIEQYIYMINQRRDMNASQRAIEETKYMEAHEAAAKRGQVLKKRSKSKGKGGGNVESKSARELAAQSAGVSPRTMDYAMSVKQNGSAKLIKAVADGQIQVSRAGRLAELIRDKTRQDQLLREGPNSIKSAINIEESKRGKSVRFHRHSRQDESYYDDEGTDVPRSLYPVWRQKLRFAALKGKVEQLKDSINQINQVISLTDLDDAVVLLDQVEEFIGQSEPMRVNGEAWMAKGDLD